MNIENFKNQILECISNKYPTSIKLPVESAIHNSIENFFRPTPQRKIAMVYAEDGDYEYDGDLTQQMEFEMEKKCDNLFYDLSIQLEKELGIGSDNLDYNSMFHIDYDEVEHKDGLIFDNILWSFDYEGGAVFTDCDPPKTKSWQVEGQWFILQNCKWYGDGNFCYFVCCTITPVISKINQI